MRILVLLAACVAVGCENAPSSPSGGVATDLSMSTPDSSAGGAPDLSMAAADLSSSASSPDLTSPPAPPDLATAAAPFSAVQAIFDQYCIGCHDANLPPGNGNHPALPLTAGASYAALVNVPSPQSCGGLRVTPGDASNSYLFHKINDAAPCSGMRMPRSKTATPPPVLSAQELGTVSSWIQAGASP